MKDTIQGSRYASNKYHRLYELGHAYTFSDYFVVPAHGILDFMADTSLVTVDYSEGFPPIVTAGGGPFLLDMYNVADADDDGIVLEGFNRNGIFASKAYETKLSLNPTINDVGHHFSGIPIPGDRTGAFSTVFTVADSLPYRPVIGSKILMRLENDSHFANLVGFRVDWYEY